MNNVDLRSLKLQNILTFHGAAAKFHSDALTLCRSMHKKLKVKDSK
jgi:hypothetical protein